MSEHRSVEFSVISHWFVYAAAPNWAFNADANTGHAFGILMACVGTLRASRSGAG